VLAAHPGGAYPQRAAEYEGVSGVCPCRRGRLWPRRRCLCRAASMLCSPAWPVQGLLRSAHASVKLQGAHPSLTLSYLGGRAPSCTSARAPRCTWRRSCSCATMAWSPTWCACMGLSVVEGAHGGHAGSVLCDGAVGAQVVCAAVQAFYSSHLSVEALETAGLDSQWVASVSNNSGVREADARVLCLRV